MKPFGKTCLIKCIIEDGISNEKGIFIINNIDKINDVFWKGVIENYGTLVTDEELVNLPKIGSKIVMSYGKETSDKGGVKLVLGNSVKYIRSIDEILGVIDDE